MNYNSVGPWNDAELSLEIEESRMLVSVLFALNGREVDPFLQGPNMIRVAAQRARSGFL